MWQFVTAALVLLVVYYAYYKYKIRTIFDRLGLPTPTVCTLRGGHYIPGIRMELYFRILAKQCGTTFGFHYLGTPHIITTDLDIINDVFFRKFADFHGRLRQPLLDNPDLAQSNVPLFQSNGPRWHRQRSIITAIFSTANIKLLFPVMRERAEVLLEKAARIGKEGQVAIECHPLWTAFTTDIISEVLLSDKEDYQNQTDNIYSRLLDGFFEHTPSLLALAYILPEFMDLWTFIFQMSHKLGMGSTNHLQLHEMARREIASRKAKENNKVDLAQFLIDTEVHPDDLASLTSSNGDDFAKRMSSEEIVRNIIGLLFAGSDTQSATLAFTTLLLARNAEVQEKLRAEVDKVFLSGEGEEITYEMVGEMTYADAVIKESHRLYPHAAGVHSRRCMSATKVGKGAKAIEVPKGVIVMVNTWAMHNDEKLWGEDVGEFRPERWTEQPSHLPPAVAYMPFGAGRRICPGLRLAQVQMKCALAMLLRRFLILPSEETPWPLEIGGPGSIHPKKSFVHMKPRY